MTGDHASRAAPLRTTDPGRLGRYTLLGRLGEGGMGTVYLARTADDRPVAVKMIRTDLAPDRAFRQRFRSEVNRARQVPPFCTAEVLDADPEHEPPYLVVEYVDGPSLEAVVQEQGPLTPANLHGVAIGVATALTAIHGAGVIHRDLKPNNVLLAPGSPKVIDFGIARAMDATSHHTGAGQMLGTVAYMAPERFGSTAGTELTPAADIFAWGAIVAYAGTGRTPFPAENAPLVAVRILTEPPELTGLTSPLRELVERALAKDPADRPAARELLELLLTTGPARTPALAAALADQPALRLAAQEAQAATDHGPDGAVTAVSTEPVGRTQATGALSDATVRLPTQRTGPPPGLSAAAAVPVWGAATAATATGRRRGMWWRRVAVASLVLAVLLSSLTVAGLVAGVIPLPGNRTPGGTGPGAVGPEDVPALQVITRDPLTRDGRWRTRIDSGHDVTCTFDGGLVVTRRKPGPYRCPGPEDNLTDFTASVDVRFLSPGSCAGIWFRFTDLAGYVLRVCPEGYYVATHGFPESTRLKTLRTLRFATKVPVDTTVRVTITARGNVITLYRDGVQLGILQDTTFSDGRVALGICQDQSRYKGPYRVAFNNIDILA